MQCCAMTASSCLVAQAFLVPRRYEDLDSTFLQFGNGLTFLRKSYRVNDDSTGGSRK